MGGVPASVYTMFKATGAKIEDIMPLEIQSDKWWRAIASNVRELLKVVLETKLIEGSSTGWLLDYICRGAAVEYHAFSKQDLLICLLASGALADKALDAAKPIVGYADVFARTLKLMHLEGIESQLSVVLLKGECPPAPQVSSWHPLNFCGDLSIPEEVYNSWKMPKTLSGFLKDTQTLVQRLGCRANTAVYAVNASESEVVCGQAIVQDVDSTTSSIAWWPQEYQMTALKFQAELIKWYTNRIAQHTASLSTNNKDWSKAAPVDPTPELMQHVLSNDEQANPGVFVIMRFTLFPPENGAWFSGNLDAGSVANDLTAKLVWTLKDDGGKKAWHLTMRESLLEYINPGIVQGVDHKGVLPEEFDPIAIVQEGLKLAKLQASSIEHALA